MLLGFGAGVMLAASIFSLLILALAAAQAQATSSAEAAVLVAIALGAGAALLLRWTAPCPTRTPDGNRSATAVWLFVFAIAVHNIPEGLAIGVASNSLGSANAVATGISLQNVPEGLIIAIALATAGYSRALAFAVAAGSGLIEPVAAVLGSLMVANSEALLPWGWLARRRDAFRRQPRNHSRNHIAKGTKPFATSGLIVGFVTMLRWIACSAEITARSKKWRHSIVAPFFMFGVASLTPALAGTAVAAAFRP